jgi:uncharacterized protein (TIGR00369 family)
LNTEDECEQAMHELNEHKLIKNYIRYNRFGEILGMHFRIMSPGNVEYLLQVVESHLATPQSVHGGVISALLDATMGVGALSAVCEEEKVVSTIEMKVSFLRSAILGDELVATSEILKKGNKIIFVEAYVRNQHDELVAKSSGIFNAYPKEKAGY